MTVPAVTMKVADTNEEILERLRQGRMRQIPLVDGTGHLIALATYEMTPDAGMVVMRSTVLLPMTKRKRWRRLLFCMRQDDAAMSLIATGY